MTTAKGSKLLRYVEHRIRVTVQDGRVLIGTFMAFDKHLNLVLSDTEEYRSMSKASSNRSSSSNNNNSSDKNDNSKSKLSNIVEERQEKRLLGLIILRGENVVSIAVEGPPPSEQRAKVMPGGPGVAKGVGRGMPPPSISQHNQGQGVGVPMGLGPGAVPGVGVGSVAFPPPPGMGMGMGMGMGRGFPPPPMR